MSINATGMKGAAMEAIQEFDQTGLNIGPSTGEVGQYVTFTLADEEYGVDIMRVQEIIGYRGFTKIPNVNPFIKGVLNLRGTVVPVIDLRLKFNLAEKAFDQFTVIMIVEVSGRIMGIIVDSVSDVVTLEKEDIRETPRFSNAINTDFINGMGKKEDKFIILLDIDKVLTDREMEEVDGAL
jgi:purine-binding chemotaxis protein CheW